MPEPTTHPSRAALSAYNLGQLPHAEAAAIENHINECEPCCETIVGMSSDDTFVALLQEARRLPVDQTRDHDSQAAQPSSSYGDIPLELAEHPRYEIVRLIGKGGMGDVYEARHRKMERRVALKVINRELFQKAEVVNRFHREVKTAARLSHPNIVTSHDADQAGDFHFLVMEYVDGVDLSQIVRDKGALPIADACDYIRQAAIGLQHAHESGMVHRDIKPHNLMVTKDGTVKILDFGLASLVPEAIPASDAVEARSDLTAAGAIMGTPDFISPEQANDARQVDIRSDIYSLGATLYFLLSGRPLFADGSVMHKLKSHAQTEPEPLDSLRDDVPPELVAVVTKMTAKDPEERYLTPKEVAEALESFLSTWQSGEENTPRRGASNGGNNSDSGRQRHTADDSNPSRLPMVAKFLLYTSLLPIGLLVLNEFVPLGLFSGETDWFWYCLLTSIALSTIGGIVLGVHQGMSNIRDGQRINGMTTGQTALIIICLGVSAFIFLNHMSDGKWHLEVTPQSDRMTLGTHPLTIVDTSGKKPLGGTTSTHQDDASGITTHSFKSANGRYNITLVDKALTVNGERYTLENPTDVIRIVDDRVEITQVTSLPDGERFQSKALSDDIEVRQILDRMEKAYAQCNSYRDSGVTKSVFLKNTVSPEFTVEYSFTTAFVRPDRFRFEIKDEDDERSLIFVNGQDFRTWWDVEPGIQEPESLEIAMAQAIGFSGGDVGRIPGMLMPQRLGGWVDLDLIDPKPIEDGELQNIECFRLEYSFRDEQVTLWIDKQSYLVRRIDERIKADDVRIERTTTFDPTIDGKITDQMLEFDPPSGTSSRIILDQGYTILDGGKEIGSRHLVVTENDETLSIVEEYSLALQFDGAPLGIVERGVSAVYSVAGDTPLLMRGTNSTKEQGALVMHGTVEFENGEAEMRWTSHTDGGRKLDRPSKQQSTIKPPPGPLVLGSTIQVVGPLLLPEDGERKVVCATFNNRVREGKPLVEYEAGCRLKRTSRPEGAGFTITVFEPDSDKPEMTWEYDSQGNCKSIQLTSTTVMKPHGASDEAAADIAPVGGQFESSDEFERDVAIWVLENGGTVVLKNSVGRLEKVENLDDLPNRPFTITHIGLKNAKDEDLKRLEGLSFTTLSLSSEQLTDAGLASLDRVGPLNSLFLRDCPRVSLSNVFAFRDVKTLKLNNTPAVSDEALESLNELPSIQYLDIGENKQFTDQALVHIAELKTLDYLVLESTAITDAGLKHLAPLDELLALDLSSTAIGDAGLKHLAPLDQLYSLNLSSTEITDDGLKHLAQLEELFHLNLSSTAITDAGLKHLASTDLYELNLDSTAISDTGLKQLATMDGLAKLSLSGTRVTARGIEDLRKTRSEEFQIDWQLGADDVEQTDKKVQSAKPPTAASVAEQISRGLVANAQISAIEMALDQYRLDCLSYPSTEEGLRALIEKPADEKLAENWSGPYLKELTPDPWGSAFQYAFPGTRNGDETRPDVWSHGPEGPDGKNSTNDDIGNWVTTDAAPLDQIANLLTAWRKLPEQSEKPVEFAEKINSLHKELYEKLKPNTESHRQASQRLAAICWPHLLDAIPKSMAEAMVDLTKPDAGIRISDRLADAGRPTEPLSWDGQAAHALALARAGKIEEALKENETLMRKIEINVRKGRSPDSQSEFLGTMRSQKSLLQQSLLQKALILAIAGKTAESVDASTAAGRVEVNKPTEDDPAGIQAMLPAIVKAAERSADEKHNSESDGAAIRKTTEFLVEAVKSGDTEAVKAALKADVSPNVPANPFAAKQLTALHWAVAQRISDGKTVEPTPEIAKLLIEAGADVNAADYLGQTPLEWAAKYAPPEIVEMLIKAGADVNAESRYGTVLMAGTRIEIAKLLIEAGVDVNAGKYTSALANAAKYGNAELIRLLVKEGAKVNDPKDPPIHWAGKPEAAKALLDAGADANQCNANGETALHLAKNTWSPNAETVKLLIEAGADVKAKNVTGATPLHAAVQQAKPEVAKLLVEAGADVDAKDKQGNTPLSLAHQALSWARGQQQVDNRPYEAAVEVLVDAGAKDNGRTELQQAVAAGDLEQVKKLIAARVDVNATGPQRITAVHIASEKGHAEILAALIEAGAKFDQTDEQQMRPLHFAANAGIARMLIAEGAKVDSPAPSPLYMATMAGKSDVVRELLRANATVQDSHGAEMLNWATFAGQIEVVKVLFEQREAKTLLNARNVYSPLHVAASGTFGGMNSPEDVTPERRLEIAKLLVEKGADVNAKWGTNVNPQSGAAHMIDTTPLMFASSKGEAEMVKFLLDKGADAKAANASGQTALHFAAQQGHRAVVELLLNAKSDVNALTRDAKTPLDLTQDAAVKVLLIQAGGKSSNDVLKDSQR